jgi:hypothetical protein
MFTRELKRRNDKFRKAAVKNTIYTIRKLRKRRCYKNTGKRKAVISNKSGQVESKQVADVVGEP